MITKKDIQDLAVLARLEIEDSEAESLTAEIDSILGYVGQIQQISVAENADIPVLKNVMREDVVTHESGEYTESVLGNAPAREKDYLKVKKILE